MTVLADSGTSYYDVITSGPGIGGGLVGYLLVSLFLGMTFAKAGEEAWKGWVPIYSTVVAFRLAGLSGWLVLTLIIPLVNLVVWILWGIRYAKAFGKSAVFGFFLLAWLLLIGLIIIASDPARYDRSRLPN